MANIIWALYIKVMVWWSLKNLNSQRKIDPDEPMLTSDDIKYG